MPELYDKPVLYKLYINIKLSCEYQLIALEQVKDQSTNIMRGLN